MKAVKQKENKKLQRMDCFAAHAGTSPTRNSATKVNELDVNSFPVILNSVWAASGTANRRPGDVWMTLIWKNREK